jgi:hypothetical protein
VAGGFRPDLVVFLLPAWVYGSFPRGWRRLGGGVAALAVVIAGWLGLTIALSGGWGMYLATSSARYALRNRSWLAWELTARACGPASTKVTISCVMQNPHVAAAALAAFFTRHPQSV